MQTNEMIAKERIIRITDRVYPGRLPLLFNLCKLLKKKGYWYKVIKTKRDHNTLYFVVRDIFEMNLIDSTSYISEDLSEMEHEIIDIEEEMQQTKRNWRLGNDN